VATGRDEIKIWNYEEGERIGQFRNQNEKPSRITALSWVNPHDDALLLTGTDDGVARVWSTKYDHDASAGPLAAFTAVPDLVAGNRGSGLVMEWQQNRGLLLATGNSVLLRCWDLTTEKCLSSVPTGSKSACVTSIASWNDGTNIVLACGDGSLHMFDLRSPISAVEVASKREHKNWVVNIHRQVSSDHLLTSCSVVGDVKIWDSRNMSHSLSTLKAHREGEPCTAFAVHDYAPVFASGSHKQFIRIFDTQNNTLSRIHFHDGFLGQRIGPVSCLAFHPYKMCLAAGATDSIISIYTER
jgi:regulatory associated protein of mTOR